MTNRERVLKGLKCCANGCLGDCPYFKTDECGQLLPKDALELLKEQERIIEYMRKSNTEWCEKNCPYAPDCGPAGVCNQVVSLLKEKEAVLVDTKMIGMTNGTDIEVYCCRDCRTVLDPAFHYCPNCGQQVDWNEQF